METEGLKKTCEAVRDGGANVLVLAPAFTDSEAALCDCLLTGQPLASTDLLSVTFDDSAADRLAAWRDRHDALPANTGLIEVGGPDSGADLPESVETVAVSGPEDLTTTGVRLSDVVADWEDSGNQLVACFHGLTVLLQHVELDRLYRFLHIVVRRLSELDAVAHYHIDPTVLAERELGILLSLFDAVIEYEDGDWRLRQR